MQASRPESNEPMLQEEREEAMQSRSGILPVPHAFFPSTKRNESEGKTLKRRGEHAGRVIKRCKTEEEQEEMAKEKAKREAIIRNKYGCLDYMLYELFKQAFEHAEAAFKETNTPLPQEMSLWKEDVSTHRTRQSGIATICSKIWKLCRITEIYPINMLEQDMYATLEGIAAAVGFGDMVWEAFCIKKFYPHPFFHEFDFRILLSEEERKEWPERCTKEMLTRIIRVAMSKWGEEGRLANLKQGPAQFMATVEEQSIEDLMAFLWGICRYSGKFTPDLKYTHSNNLEKMLFELKDDGFKLQTYCCSILDELPTYLFNECHQTREVRLDGLYSQPLYMAQALARYVDCYASKHGLGRKKTQGGGGSFAFHRVDPEFWELKKAKTLMEFLEELGKVCKEIGICEANLLEKGLKNNLEHITATVGFTDFEWSHFIKKAEDQIPSSIY